MGPFFKVFPDLSQKLRKFWKHQVNLLPNLAKIGLIGHFFLEKLVFVWVYFQIPRQHFPIKTKLEYPPPIHHLFRCWNYKQLSTYMYFICDCD